MSDIKEPPARAGLPRAIGKLFRLPTMAGAIWLAVIAAAVALFQVWVVMPNGRVTPQTLEASDAGVSSLFAPDVHIVGPGDRNYRHYAVEVGAIDRIDPPDGLSDRIDLRLYEITDIATGVEYQLEQSQEQGTPAQRSIADIYVLAWSPAAIHQLENIAYQTVERRRLATGFGGGLALSEDGSALLSLDRQFGRSEVSLRDPVAGDLRALGQVQRNEERVLELEGPVRAMQVDRRGQSGVAVGAGFVALYDGFQWAEYPVPAFLGAVDAPTELVDVWVDWPNLSAMAIGQDGTLITFNAVMAEEFSAPSPLPEAIEFDVPSPLQGDTIGMSAIHATPGFSRGWVVGSQGRVWPIENGVVGAPQTINEALDFIDVWTNLDGSVSWALARSRAADVPAGLYRHTPGRGWEATQSVWSRSQQAELGADLGVLVPVSMAVEDELDVHIAYIVRGAEGQPSGRSYIARAWLIGGTPAVSIQLLGWFSWLLLLAAVIVVPRRASPADADMTPVEVIESKLQSDKPIEHLDDAPRALGELAERLAGFILNRDTSAPMTIGITGAWGSGKSSLMKIIEHRLRGEGACPVWFNAWHHQNEEHLFAALMEAVRRAVPPVWTSAGIVVRYKLLRRRVCADPLKAALGVVLWSALVAVALVMLWHSGVIEWASGEKLPDASLQDRLLGGAGLAGLLALLLRTVSDLRTIQISPARLLGQAGGVMQFARFEERLNFRHKFGAAFGDVCAVMEHPRLVLIIDDLDRCRKHQIVEVLEAVNFLTSSGDCFVLLGLEEEAVLNALAQSIEAPNSDGTDEKSKIKRAEHYLEKLVNLTVPVPLFDMEAVEEMLSRSRGDAPVAPRRTGPQRHGAWEALLLGALLLVAAGTAVSAIWPQPAERGGVETEAAGEPVLPDTAREAGSDAGDNGEPGEPVTDGATTELGSVTTAEGIQLPTVVSLVDPVYPELTFMQQAGRYGLVILFALGLMYLVFAGPVRWYRERQDHDDLPTRDSDAFQRAINTWLPAVSQAVGTPRAAKRFVNRMRYLTVGLTAADAIMARIAFGAMDEIGCFPAARGAMEVNPLLREIVSGFVEKMSGRTGFSPPDNVETLHPVVKELTRSQLQGYLRSASSASFSRVAVPPKKREDSAPPPEADA